MFGEDEVWVAREPVIVEVPLVWVDCDDDVVEAGTDVELDADPEAVDESVCPSAKMVPNAGVRREEVSLQQFPS